MKFTIVEYFIGFIITTLFILIICMGIRMNSIDPYDSFFFPERAAAKSQEEMVNEMQRQNDLKERELNLLENKN